MPSKADIRALKRVLESRDVASALTAYLSRFKVRKAPSLHAEKQKQKRLGRKEAVAAVRPLVEARAAGRCECGCGAAFGSAYFGKRAEWDEFHGRQHVSVAETWMLTSFHHRLKTENRPTRAFWDEAFRRHCAKYNYPFRPRLVKAARSAPKERGVTNG